MAPKKRKLMSSVEVTDSNVDNINDHLYEEADKDILAAFTAAKKARSSVKKLQNQVGDQLSWLALQQLLDPGFDTKISNARELLHESRCRQNEKRLLDILHLDLVMLILFKFLPMSDILKLTLVCNRMNLEVRRLWDKCRVWNIQMNQSFNPAQHFFKANTDLKLDFHHYTLVSPVYKQIITKCAHRIVSMTNVPSETLDVISKSACRKMSRLETFKVRGHSKNTLIIINQSADSLQTIYLSFIKDDGAMFHKKLPNLKKLSLVGFKNEELLLSLIKNSASSLQDLKVGDAGYVNSLSKLDSTLNINSLSLGDFATLCMDWSAFAALINSSPKLDKLSVRATDFSCCSDVPHNIKLDNLKSISLFRSRFDLANESLQYYVQILEACKNSLEYLELELRNPAASRLLNYDFFLPKVRKAKVTHCYNVRKSAVQNHVNPGTEIEMIFFDYEEYM